MRVAFFSGPIEYSICLANALSDHCDVDFFYSEYYARQRDERLLGVLDPRIGRVVTSRWRIRDPRNLFSFLGVARQLSKYDVIHTQIGEMWFSLWQPLFRNVPLVCTVHDPHSHFGHSNKGYTELLQRRNVRHAAHFIVHGEQLRQDLAEKHDLPLTDISVVKPGEFSFYRKLRTDATPATTNGSAPRRILFFGSIRKNKGLEYLIKAEPLISKKTSNFKIVIAGNFQGECEHYERLMTNRDRFEVIDAFIPVDQVADLFDSAYIVVLPYVTATQSGVLPLAFAFGKPVVATDTGSIKEILDHGRSGLLVPPRDEVALGEAIVDLLNDEERCLALGRQALHVAETELSWSKIAQDTVRIYESVLAGSDR